MPFILFFLLYTQRYVVDKQLKGTHLAILIYHPHYLLVEEIDCKEEDYYSITKSMCYDEIDLEADFLKVLTISLSVKFR